jgi:cyclic-di-AMP phosphodiesterase PgpH
MPKVSAKRPATVNTRRRNILTGMFLVVLAVLVYAAVISPQLLSLNSPTIVLGQVAAQDTLAKQDITYVSKVLTEQKRAEAANSVLDIYTLPDTNVARQQMEQLRNTLAYITSVRSDVYASHEQKIKDLALMDDVRLSDKAVENVLAINDARWLAVEQEAIAVLEQLMRVMIQPDGLEQARSQVPSMVSLALSPNQAGIVTELAEAFLAANSTFSPELTGEARKTAEAGIDPVTRSFVVGQTIVQRGEIIDAVDMEALEQFGLASPRQRWQDYAGSAALVLLMGIYLLFYLRYAPTLATQGRSLTLISLLMLLFLAGGRLATFGHVVIPYAYPMAGFSLLVAALFGVRVAMVASLPLAVLIAYQMPNSLDLTLYYILGSLFGILALGGARRIASFIWAGIAVTIAGWLVVIAYRLVTPTIDWVGMVTLAGAALFNGLASATLALLLQQPLAQLLGTTTPMQLMELTRPDHPMLRLILQQAPGTYQHSLQVANLAEQAAERIGADPLLTRVGALYHDAGKATNPIFFIENQLPGFDNPHEGMDPESSAATIIRHVVDGVKLARSYHLPRRVHAFITEHHGTTLTRYQYAMALEYQRAAAATGIELQVDEANFHYPGPKPQSRETAILMLADACEARVRAERPHDEEQLRELIKQTIHQRVNENELDYTDLTLRDLDTIADSFTTTLRGIYHPRIQYPALEGTHQTGESAALAPMTNGDSVTTPVPTAVNQQALQINERQIHE